MTFLDTYKRDVREIIMRTYGDKISEDKVNLMLDNIISNRKYEPVIHMRNLYKFIPDFTIPANNMIDIVKQNNLNICSNGLFTENPDNVMSPTSEILIEWKKQRTIFKNKELEAEEAGDMDTARTYAKSQYKVKADMNSMYGISTMPLSFSSNVDCGSAITLTSQNFISQNMWALESFLTSNMVFSNVNELYQHINITCKRRFTDEELSDITYIPTVKDCLDRFNKLSYNIEKFRKNTKYMTKSMYLMFVNMSEQERIAFYYTDNIYEFIMKNEKVYTLFHKCVFNDVLFENPYDIPNELSFYLSEIIQLFKTFVFRDTPTYDRVNKYKTRVRKTVLISDTDSIMPCLSLFVTNILTIYNRMDLYENTDVSVKIVNICVSIIVELCKKVCKDFAIAAGGNERFHDRLEMKNEFYFSQVILFSTIKKNYIAWKVLREGKVVPEKHRLAITGRALGSGSLNEEISTKMKDLLVENVLKCTKIDPYNIAKGKVDISNTIRDSILEGNLNYGIYKKYNGADKVKDPETVVAVRASIIWNKLYPDDEIIPGDSIYLFDTVLNTRDTIERISDKYSDIKNKIYRYVFDNRKTGEDFSRFGLTSFAIPAEGDTLKIPEWLIPFIDIDKMINKHIQPLTSILPSIGIANNKTYAKKYAGSTMIRL